MKKTGESDVPLVGTYEASSQIAADVLTQLNQSNIILMQILQELKTISDVSSCLLHQTTSGIHIKEPVLVEVDGVVSVVGH